MPFLFQRMSRLRLSLRLTASVLLLAGWLHAEDKPSSPDGELEAMFFVTLQNPNLDWWTHIPANTGPHVRGTGTLYRGQKFMVLPLVVNYTLDADSTFSLSYSIKQIDPDGTVTVICPQTSFSEKSDAPSFMRIPPGYPVGYFEETDADGEYRFELEVTDELSGQQVRQTASVELIPWENPEPIESMEEVAKGSVEYYKNFDAQWLFAAYQSPNLNMAQENTPTGYNSALLSFFKTAFDNNRYLLPYLREAFTDNNPQQRKNTILLLALLGEEPIPLKSLQQAERKYQTQCRELQYPDAYRPIDSPAQLDQLWGEFFATGNYAPVGHLVSAMNLAPYEEAVERAEKEKKAPEGKEAQKELWLGLTFRAARWSLTSNCQHHELVKKYCAWAYENDKSLKKGQVWLGVILAKAWPERYHFKTSTE